MDDILKLAPPIIVPESAESIEAVEVDGMIDEHGIQYIGAARRMPDGTWRCLANVGGALCVVEVTITL